jgi:hypothetical protein
VKIIIPVLGFGKSGGERVLSKIATELIKHNNEVFFVSPENGNIPYYGTEAKIERSYYEKRFNRVINFLITYYHMYRTCCKLNPDAVIANFHLTAYLVCFLPKKIKKIYYIQAYEVVFYQGLFRKLLAYVTYLLPLKKITNHENLLPNILNKRKIIIPAGIDINIFHRRKDINSKKNIGVIGRQEKHKGTKEIIDTIISWASNSNVVINIAIFINKEDQQRLRDNKIQFNVIGINNDYELARFYRSNDIIIAAGLVEDGAFHYPCAEAMASGCIVISNYAPLVDTDSCFKIMHFDKDLIINRLEYFMTLSQDDIQREIKKNIDTIEHYSWDIVGEKFNNTLSEWF